MLIGLIALLSAWPATARTTTFWVSPDGSDRNPGSKENPLASIDSALEKWKAQAPIDGPTETNSLFIILRGGTYFLRGPLNLNNPVLESSNRSLRVISAPDEHPVLSGGRQIQHWEKVSTPLPGLPSHAVHHVWVASVPKAGGHFLNFRQLWVNGQKAVRAREPDPDQLERLVAWDKTNQVATIPASALNGTTNPVNLEMVIDQVWEIAILRVQSIDIEGANAFLTFRQPESKIEFEHPWPPVIVNSNYCAPFYLANAIQFLDSPGEWFEDLRTGKVYYWPREGEDMTRAIIVAPVLETLVNIEGSLTNPVSNIEFKGITFSHTTWLRPSEQGHVPLQAGMFLLEARKLSPHGTSYHSGLDNLAWIGRPPGAVSVKNAHHVSFLDCTFTHLASAGLDIQSGSKDGLIQGCNFNEIGGNGIQLGMFSDTNVETHVPYNPTDEREICSNETISNNVIFDCGNEDWGCVGIGVGYARNVAIQHNEVFDLPYTGISVGWGWNKRTNCMRENLIIANRIHHIGRRLGDFGGIYTLSCQPGTLVSQNSVSDIQPGSFVPDPTHWFYLYADEGSSFMTFRDNWCPSDNFFRNANGPGNVWTNNGPQVSEVIRAAAGLERQFKRWMKQ